MKARVFFRTKAMAYVDLELEGDAIETADGKIRIRDGAYNLIVEQARDQLPCSDPANNIDFDEWELDSYLDNRPPAVEIFND